MRFTRQEKNARIAARRVAEGRIIGESRSTQYNGEDFFEKMAIDGPHR